MTKVTLPQLSLAMEEGKITRWLVADGTHVTAGQPIVEIETDKAITEVESPAAGTIRIAVEEGQSVAVETTIAEIEAGAAAGSASAAKAQPAKPEAAVVVAKSASEAPVATSSNASSAGPATEHSRKHIASPAARRIARERGITLEKAKGSGPGGRITVRDLEGVTASAKPSLREAVVAQLSASWRDIPHIHIGGELDGAGLAAAKRSAQSGITVTDLLILAIVRALRTVPELNGTLGKVSDRVHLALAVATPAGVISPVIRNASGLSLTEIAAERARVVAAARAGTSDRRDLAGGTITLTNLGAFPVDFFAPVVSGPQIAMIATGRLAERPVASNGALLIRHRMWANVAIDHRGGDGVSGARFLAALEQAMNELKP